MDVKVTLGEAGEPVRPCVLVRQVLACGGSPEAASRAAKTALVPTMHSSRSLRPPSKDALSSTGSRRALAGFFVSGVLLSFLGAILPSWKQHLSSDYIVVGLYFRGADRGSAGIGGRCAAAAGAQGPRMDAGLRVRDCGTPGFCIWPSFRRRFRFGGAWRAWR